MICNHCDKRIWFWQDKINSTQGNTNEPTGWHHNACLYDSYLAYWKLVHADIEYKPLFQSAVVRQVHKVLNNQDAKLVNTNKQVYAFGEQTIECDDNAKQVFGKGTDVGKTEQLKGQSYFIAKGIDKVWLDDERLLDDHWYFVTKPRIEEDHY